MNQTKLRNVFIMMPTSERSERLKLDGILSATNARSGAVWCAELETEDLPPRDITRRTKGFDGVIAYVRGANARRALAALPVPTILIEDISEPKHPVSTKNKSTLICDHIAEGETAAKHLLSCRFSRFAFVGSRPQTEWSELRCRGFSSYLRKRGFRTIAYPSPSAAVSFVREQSLLSKWIKALPRPCAIFAACDYRARQVLAAAKKAGLEIPGDIAILGVDNDEAFCTTTSPALSSIQTEDVRLGQLAAEMLDALMSRRETTGKVVRVLNQTVTARTSTDTDALGDPFVANTLRYVKSHLSERITAGILARQIGYSKRMLELRIQKSLGTSLGKAVRDMRISAARDLIIGSKLPLFEIASRCGFANASHLSRLVHKAFDTTPTALRRSAVIQRNVQSPLHPPRLRTPSS